MNVILSGTRYAAADDINTSKAHFLAGLGEVELPASRPRIALPDVSRENSIPFKLRSKPIEMGINPDCPPEYPSIWYWSQRQKV